MRVICTELDSSMCSANCITYGKEYHVYETTTPSVEGPMYTIVNDKHKPIQVFAYRFKEVKESIVKKVTALRNWKNQFGGITAGKEYEVKQESTSGYFVIGDGGTINHLPKVYFSVAVTGYGTPSLVKMMKYSLPDGSTLEGTVEQVTKLLSMLGVGYENDGIHYMSSSKGMLVIKEMNTPHLRNAFMKKYETWLESLRTLPLADFLMQISSGNGSDRTFVAMLTELLTRKE